MVMTSTGSPENDTGLTAVAHTTRKIRESKVQEPGFLLEKNVCTPRECTEKCHLYFVYSRCNTEKVLEKKINAEMND